MLTNALLISGSSGIISALTFLLSVMQGAVLLVYLPLIPLLLVGFYFGYKKAAAAILVASLLLLSVNDAAVATLYILFLGTPALMVSYFTMKQSNGTWYPVLKIIVNLLVYAGVMITLLTMDYAGSGTDLQAKIGAELSSITSTGMESMSDPKIDAMVNNLVTKHSYLVIAMTAWQWALMVYVMALTSHLILDSYKKNIRPDFSLFGSALPNWLLAALGVSSLVSFAAVGDVQFIARGVMLMLMLPYFLFGLVRIHVRTRELPGRKLLLSMMYVMIAFTLWPVLVIALFGVFQQMQGIGKPPVSTQS